MQFILDTYCFAEFEIDWGRVSATHDGAPSISGNLINDTCAYMCSVAQERLAEPWMHVERIWTHG